METLTSRALSNNGWVLFTLVVASSIILSYLFNYLLVDDSLYYAYFENKLSYERIEEMLYSKEKWSWLSYSLVPIYFFLKFGIVSITLLAGLFIFNFKIKLQEVFKIVVLSEIVFLIPVLVKIIWFSFFQTNYTLESLQYFSPMSLLNFFTPNELESWWIYPLKVLNIFEIGYWIIISLLLVKLTKESFEKMLTIVLLSYGTGLALWVIFITFLTVSIGS